MIMKLSNFLSKNTKFKRSHSVIKHHENKYNEEKQEQDHDHDHKQKRNKKKKKGWSFFVKNKLGSKIYRAFSKINKGNREPSSSSNKGHPQKDDDVFVEDKKQRKTVVEMLGNGIRSSGGGEVKKMKINRNRSLKRGVVVVVKKKIVMERKQSLRRTHVEEEVELCKKRILMGFKCKPLNSNGAPLYDQNGVISLD